MYRTTQMKTTLMTFLSILILFAGALPAHAHFPWINLTDYTPDQGSALKLTIGWGHRYPLAGFLKSDALETITLSGPSGEVLPIEYVSDVELQSVESLGQAGTYVVGALRKAGFYTRTTHGHKAASKEGLKGVLHCSYSHMCMKAIANVGPGVRADRVLGHPIEIIPLENPGQLRAGDYLPLRVVVNGKPYKGEVLATYVGFSMEKNVFAYATASDARGMARIRILQPGVWLVKVSHTVPYQDPTKCDAEAYVGTLTFQVD